MIFPAVFLISLIGWSLTNLLVNGSIFDSLRNYLLVKFPYISKLLSCMQCSGFWVGCLIGVLAYHQLLYNILYYVVTNQNTWYSQPLTIFFHGVFISGISVLINSLLVFFHSFARD
jgi:hypothetical protein